MFLLLGLTTDKGEVLDTIADRYRNLIAMQLERKTDKIEEQLSMIQS